MNRIVVTFDEMPNAVLPFDGVLRPAHVEWVASNMAPLPDERAWLDANWARFR